MKVSIAICTWNRAELLDKTLAQMNELVIPADVEYEIIVVNNKSTDHTNAIIDKHARCLPIRSLFEAEKGKSHACNRALAAACGELILWTDDDVLVSPQWVSAYVKAARDYPEAGFFAGPIDPWFAIQPPRWLHQHAAQLRGVYAISQFGESGPIGEQDAVFGANMAFRLELARQLPFDPMLGRVAGELIGGDDTDVIVRARQAGHHGMRVLDARVQHWIPAERMTCHYVKKWFRDAGRCLVRQGSIRRGATVWGVPRWTLKEYCRETFKRILYRPGRGRRWLDSLKASQRLAGVIGESYLQAKRHCGNHRPGPDEDALGSDAEAAS